MKKKIYFLILFIISTILTAEEVKFIKITEFNNNPIDAKTISMRLDVDDDDISGNTMLISSEGKIFIHCRDKNEVFYFDNVNKKLYPVFDTNFLPAATFASFYQITNNHYLFFGHNGNFYLVDKDYNLISSISFLHNWDIRTYFDTAFYDEDNDTLFFIDEDKGIHSILHPSLDENENKKNYYESSTTMAKLGLGKYAPHLTIDKKRYLYIDSVKYSKGYYDYEVYETKNYIISLINENCYINVYDRTKSKYFYYTVPENEKIESITYHPNGDWYFLTINWSTNKHTLWRIENIWDLEWRTQWYKNQETKTYLQDISSTNVAINKEMSCKDNLRLRSREETSSNIMTTMQKGTKVKILKLGKYETIDGISSNWVQVEVLKGGCDKDGNSINTGTVGWCYGGYLE